MDLEVLGMLFLILSGLAIFIFVFSTLCRLSEIEESIKDIHRENEFEKRLASYIESQETDND